METTKASSQHSVPSESEVAQALGVAEEHLGQHRWMSIQGLDANRDTFTTVEQMRRRIEESTGDARIIVGVLLSRDEALKTRTAK